MPVPLCILRSRRFKCSWHNAKCAFYRAFNAIFGRLGRAASSEVVLHLVRSKYIPVLLYGSNACPINAADFKSLQRTMTNIFIKIFAIKSGEVCYRMSTNVFGFQPIRNQINCREIKFLNRYTISLSQPSYDCGCHTV